MVTPNPGNGATEGEADAPVEERREGAEGQYAGEEAQAAEVDQREAEAQAEQQEEAAAQAPPAAEQREAVAADTGEGAGTGSATTGVDAYDDMLQRLPRMDMQAWAEETGKAVSEAIEALIAGYETTEASAASSPSEAPPERDRTVAGRPAEQHKPTGPVHDAWKEQLDEDALVLRELTIGKAAEAIRQAVAQRRDRAAGTGDDVHGIVWSPTRRTPSEALAAEQPSPEAPADDAGLARKAAPEEGTRFAPPQEAGGEPRGGAPAREGGSERAADAPKEVAAGGRRGAATGDAGSESAGAKPQEARRLAEVARGPTELSRALHDVGEKRVRQFKDVNGGVLPVVTVIGQKLLVRDDRGRPMGDVRAYWKGTSGTGAPATNLKPGTYVADTSTGEVYAFKGGKMQLQPAGKLRPFEARSSSEAIGSGHVDLFVGARFPARRQAFLDAISAGPAGLDDKEARQPYRALVLRVPDPKDLMAQDQQQEQKWSHVKRDAWGGVNEHIEASLKGMVKHPEHVIAGVLAGTPGLYAAGVNEAMRFGDAKAMAAAAQTRDELLMSRDLCSRGIANTAILGAGKAVGASAGAAIGRRFATDPNALLRASAAAVLADRSAARAGSGVGAGVGGAGVPGAGAARGGFAAGGGSPAGGAGGAGGGGGRRPPSDTVPDATSDTLPGPLAAGRQPRGGLRDTVPDDHADTLPDAAPPRPERGPTPRRDTLPGMGPPAPERPVAGRVDTLRGLGPPAPLPARSLREHWERAGRSPESDHAAPAGRRGGTDTMPPYSDRQIRFLGGDVADKAARMGISASDLDRYAALLTWREHMRGRDTDTAARNAAATAGEQINRADALGPELSGKLTQYGFSPDDIAQRLADAATQRLSREETLASLRAEARLMDHLRDEFCGGDIGLARRKLAAAGDARQAIQLDHWSRQLQAWNAAHPAESPGADRLAAFNRRAARYVREIEHTQRRGPR